MKIFKFCFKHTNRFNNKHLLIQNTKPVQKAPEKSILIVNLKSIRILFPKKLNNYINMKEEEKVNYIKKIKIAKMV